MFGGLRINHDRKIENAGIKGRKIVHERAVFKEMHRGRIAAILLYRHQGCMGNIKKQQGSKAMSAIVALDLGTTTGWAITQGGIITSGHKCFLTKPPQHPGKRYELFYSWLREELDGKDVEAIYYEKVMNHTAVAAAHVYGAMEGLMLKFACHRRIPAFGKGVGEIKKFWTGKGNAKKKDMIEVAHKHGFTGVFDDNQGDALALLHYAIHIIKG